MLWRKFKQIIYAKPDNNVAYRSIITSRIFSKRCLNLLVAVSSEGGTMSSSLRLRRIFKDLVFTKLFSVWTRSYIVSSVFKRCRKDRGVREVIQCFRQAISRPKRALLFSVTAAYKSKDETPGPPGACSENIKDEELQSLVDEFEGVEELAHATLYCQGCAKRVVINKQHPGVLYCQCKDAIPPQASFDGWLPYMEADDVVIWRKEYKPGKGLYAYKVYGRYSDVNAEDFAAVQVDGAYRKVWDAAVAALSVVQRQANGVRDQAVLHWEVLWPRLFANRDYVYVRRHKEFDIRSRCYAHKEGIFGHTCPPAPIDIVERPNVHSNAKRKALENDQMEQLKGNNRQDELKDNKAYIIVSRSCLHPHVPETRNAVRVMEYWSHMVVKTLDGPDKLGMEFVLTYYDEPGGGGVPAGVTSWATGRAAPAFLARMRSAAQHYAAWRRTHHTEDMDFTPFGPEKVSYEDSKRVFNEQDMESSKQGPDLNYAETKEVCTQTEEPSSGPKEDAKLVTTETQDETKAEVTPPETEVTPPETEVTPPETEVAQDAQVTPQEAETSISEVKVIDKDVSPQQDKTSNAPADGPSQDSKVESTSTNTIESNAKTNEDTEKLQLEECSNTTEGESERDGATSGEDKPEEENNGRWWRSPLET